MGIKDKMKTYNFWISLVSALLLVARILGTKYGFTIDSGLVMDVTTAMCSVFVILGIISAPQKVVTKYSTEYNTNNSGENKEGGLVAIESTEETIIEQPEDKEQDKTDQPSEIEETIVEQTPDQPSQENEIEPIIIEEPQVESSQPIIDENTEISETAEQENTTDSTIGNLEEMSRESLIKIILSLQQ